MFAPVTMIVWPLKSVVGYGSIVNWDLRKSWTKSEGRLKCPNGCHMVVDDGNSIDVNISASDV